MKLTEFLYKSHRDCDYLAETDHTTTSHHWFPWQQQLCRGLKYNDIRVGLVKN